MCGLWKEVFCICFLLFLCLCLCLCLSLCLSLSLSPSLLPHTILTSPLIRGIPHTAAHPPPQLLPHELLARHLRRPDHRHQPGRPPHHLRIIPLALLSTRVGTLSALASAMPNAGGQYVWPRGSTAPSSYLTGCFATLASASVAPAVGSACTRCTQLFHPNLCLLPPPFLASRVHIGGQRRRCMRALADAQTGLLSRG